MRDLPLLHNVKRVYMDSRVTKKKMKRKAMKGLRDDYHLGNWMKWLKYKRCK